MSIWWFFWFILSFILLGATAWSQLILWRQKRTWEQYAKNHNLVFVKGRFSASPSIEGTIDDFNISMFSATQQQEDSRKNRQLTVLELTCAKPFFSGLAVGTPEMLPFLKSLDLLSPHPLNHEKWDSKHNHIYSHNKEAVDKFLTPERIVILNNILKLSNSDNIALINDEQSVFRFETSNPLTDIDKLENLVSKLMKNIEKLRPGSEEIKVLTSLYKGAPKQEG